MARATARKALSEGKQRRAREYELIYILTPGVNPDEADRIAARIEEIIGGRDGKLMKLDNWGRRRLAYPIKGHGRGVFVYVRFAGYEDLVSEIERNLRMLDPVVRYQTILLNPQIDIDAIEVDPADVAFQRLEADDHADEPEIAQRLGLAERTRPARREAGEEG